MSTQLSPKDIERIRLEAFYQIVKGFAGVACGIYLMVTLKKPPFSIPQMLSGKWKAAIPQKKN